MTYKCYVLAYVISASVRIRKSLAMPVFHAFTGCDTVAPFAQVGKETAWQLVIQDFRFTLSFFGRTLFAACATLVFSNCFSLKKNYTYIKN